MDPMVLLVGLTLIVFFALVFLYHAWQYRKEQKVITQELAQEVETLLSNMRDQEKLGEDASKGFLQSAKYLTTLCTVLVHKAGGSVRLTEADFHDVTTDDYVSIYVDTTDSSLLLALNSMRPSRSDDDDEPVYH